MSTWRLRKVLRGEQRLVVSNPRRADVHPSEKGRPTLANPTTNKWPRAKTGITDFSHRGFVPTPSGSRQHCSFRDTPSSVSATSGSRSPITYQIYYIAISIYYYTIF